MKKYIKPSIEVIEYSLADVISVSIPEDEGKAPDGGSPGSNGNGNGGTGLDGWGASPANNYFN